MKTIKRTISLRSLEINGVSFFPYRPLPPLNPGRLPPAYFTLGESRLEGPSSMRDPGVELAEKASSSREVPAPPIPPPELTSNGKPLTKKQKKEVSPPCISHGRVLACVTELILSSSMSLLAQIGSTYPHRPRLISLGYIEKLKHSVFGINSTLNVFTGKMRAREKESRVYPSTSRYVSGRSKSCLDLGVDLLLPFPKDRYHYSIKHTVWYSQW